MDNPEKLTSIHVFCEIRKNNQVWIVDPLAGRILNDRSLADIMQNPDIYAQIWPDRKDFLQNLKNCVMLTDSFPQDYCIRNQVLYKKLHSILQDKCPAFGEDPVERQMKYINMMKTAQASDCSIHMMLWSVPFKVLCRDIIQNLTTN